MSTKISFHCPHCRRPLVAKAGMAGHNMFCPAAECRGLVTVPGLQTNPPPAAGSESGVVVSPFAEVGPSERAPVSMARLGLVVGGFVGVLLIPMVLAVVLILGQSGGDKPGPVALNVPGEEEFPALTKPPTKATESAENKTPENKSPEPGPAAATNQTTPEKKSSEPGPAATINPKEKEPRPALPPPLTAPDPEKKAPPPATEPKKNEPAGKEKAKKGNNLIPLFSLGPEETLDKLKAVSLVARASFSKAQNVNDVTVMWSWDPKITVLFREVTEEKGGKQLVDLARTLGNNPQTAFRQVGGDLKKQLRLDAKQERRFDDEVNQLVAVENYRPFFDLTFVIEGEKAYLDFSRGRFPLRETAAPNIRPLCYALSVSNLVPLTRHAFRIEPAKPATVKGRECRHFRVQDPQGVKLDLYLDAETEFLVKLAHRGNSPEPEGLKGLKFAKDVLWEHYFSDYRKTGEINQWRQHEAHVNGKKFAALNVTDVRFFEELPEQIKGGGSVVAGGPEPMNGAANPKGVYKQPKPKMKEAPKTKAADKSLAEQKALDKLNQAKDTIKEGKLSLAKVRLQIIVDDFPMTQAAVEARKLLADVERKLKD